MKAKILEKLKLNLFSKKSGLLIFILIFAVFLFLPAPVQASWPARIISGLIGYIIGGMGLILVAAVRALTWVAQYTYFLDSGAVSYGWVVVRDLCNMFFVVVLLIIAFGTILNIEKYNYKKWLPKLILMAILINFSKTICGLLIDVAQVVMMTFVASFADISSATLLDVLGIDDILQLDKGGKLDFWTVVGSYILGLAYVVIALIVVVTMMVMLAVRIVMIWIYIVLSPLAYLLQAFPGGQQYASQWWSDFIKNLIVGPVLAFFLWLSFAGLQADNLRDSKEDSKYMADMKDINENASTEQKKFGEKEILDKAAKETDKNNPGKIPTKGASPEAIIKFVIAIGMLVGGLKISQQIGGAAGSMAGKGMNYVNKAGSMSLKGAAAITGVRAAQGVYKNYVGARKSKREDRYKDTMLKMTGGLGKAKKAVGGKVTKFAQNISPWGGSRRKANELEAEVKRERGSLDVLQSNYDNKEGKVGDYEYNKKKKEWMDSNNNIISKDTIEESLKSQEVSVKEKEDRLVELREKQKKVDKSVQAGGLVLAGLAGLLIPGGGLAGMAVLGGGAASAYGAYSKLKNTGKKDESIASNFRLGQIKKAEEGLKDEDNSMVLSTMDNPSSSSLKRAAATLEAMRRGLLSADKAREKKEKIMKEMGGADKEGNFKDKKVGSYVESVLQKHNLSASNDFQDLSSGNLATREKAEITIRDRIISGDIKLKDLDKGGAQLARGFVAKVAPLKSFKKGVEEIIDPGKKKELQTTLVEEIKKIDAIKPNTESEKDNIIKSRVDLMQKINWLSDIKVATASVSDPSEKQNYQKEITSSLLYSELKDIFTGANTEQQKAIQELYKNIKADEGKTKLETLFKTAFNDLSSVSPEAKMIREAIAKLDLENLEPAKPKTSSNIVDPQGRPAVLP